MLGVQGPVVRARERERERREREERERAFFVTRPAVALRMYTV